MRMYRQFHAEVAVYAPKERTLFNYQVKVIYLNIFPVRTSNFVTFSSLGRLAEASRISRS